AARANSTNNVNTTSTPLNTANTLVNTTSLLRNVSAAGPSYPDLSSYANQDDSQIPSLEDIYEVPNDGIFINASYNDEGVVVDFTNLKYTVNIEPKKISQALEDKSWVDAIKGLIDKTLFIKKDKNDIMLVKQREDGIFISQDKYVTEILKKFDFMSVKTASTLTETKQPLVKDAEAADVDVHLYRSMIGYLIYLTASRPDIMYAVCDCFRFQVTSKTSHLHAMKRIFRGGKMNKVRVVIHLADGLWCNDDYLMFFGMRIKGYIWYLTEGNAQFIGLWTFYRAFFHLGLVSLKMRSLGACIQAGEEKG
nr:hypothetical protein [Tanacetum cinerariifolium]